MKNVLPLLNKTRGKILALQRHFRNASWLRPGLLVIYEVPQPFVGLSSVSPVLDWPQSCATTHLLSNLYIVLNYSKTLCNDISPFDPSRGDLSASCTSGICRLEVSLADFVGLMNGISSAGFFLLVFPLFKNPFFIPAKPSLFCAVGVGTSTVLARSRAGVDREGVVKYLEQSSRGGTSTTIFSL